MRESQNCEDKTEDSYDNNGECKHIAVCNVLHNDPSLTDVLEGQCPPQRIERGLTACRYGQLLAVGILSNICKRVNDSDKIVTEVAKKQTIKIPDGLFCFSASKPLTSAPDAVIILADHKICHINRKE